jgi:hypothetical protein
MVICIGRASIRVASATNANIYDRSFILLCLSEIPATTPRVYPIVGVVTNDEQLQSDVE